MDLRNVTFLCSFKKSGRTYLRFMLANYLNEAFKLGVDIAGDGIFQILPNLSGPEKRALGAFRFEGTKGLPVIVSAHEPFTEEPFGHAPVIFLFRGPHDTLTSLYFNEVHHSKKFDGAVEDLLAPSKTGERDGCSEWAEHLNSWAAALPRLKNITMTYERLLTEPLREMDALLRFLGLVPDPAILAAAVESSRFERMRELEMKGQLIPGKEYDPNDSRARRVREGVVGGHARHLTPELIDRVSERLDSLLSAEAKALLVAQGLTHSVSGRA